MNQLVIRGAIVVDGLGNDPVRADVAVHDGRIRAVGDVRGGGEREIDADGLASLVLADDEHEDAELVLVVTDSEGRVLAQQPTRKGEKI